MRVEMRDGANVARLKEIAQQAVDPCVTSSAVVAAFWGDTGGGGAIDPQAGYEAVQAQVKEVRDGGLSGAEATLVGQAIALNVIFAEMARRGEAALNMPGNAAERYLRLAMKAQAQCRATLHELGALANRPAKEDEVTPQYTRIERVIVYPPRYDEEGRRIPSNEPEGADDWRARGEGREVRYG